MNYFIDTNIFLRPFVNDDKKVALECLNLFNLIKAGKIEAFTSNFVLAEINWTLASFYKFPKEKVISVIKSILALRGLKIYDYVDINMAIEIYENNNIKFIDALLASNYLIFNKQAAIISYDKDFDKLKVIRIEPGKLRPKK